MTTSLVARIGQADAEGDGHRLCEVIERRAVDGRAPEAVGAADALERAPGEGDGVELTLREVGAGEVASVEVDIGQRRGHPVGLRQPAVTNGRMLDLCEIARPRGPPTPRR